jgi:hypothetical protein
MNSSLHRRVLGLLSRPQLAQRHVAVLRKLAAADPPERLPRLPCTNLLEPLYSHHLLTNGIEPHRLFQDFEPGVAQPPAFVDLVHVWSQRRAAICAFAEAVESSDSNRVMIFKGAANAFLYPIPALRQMADLDCVVASDDLSPTRKVLSELGFRQARTPLGETWSSKEFALGVDLHVARDGASLSILERAIPAGRLHASPAKLAVPDHSDHLVLVALHAADNAGNRIWIDVCDVHALLAAGARPDEAISRSTSLDAVAPVSAFLAFMARWCGLKGVAPDVARKDAAELLQLFESAAVQETSPVELSLIGNMLYDTPVNMINVLSGRTARKDFPSSNSSERDPVLGRVPAGGTLQRQFFKLGLLLKELRTGKLLPNARLAFRQARLRKNRRLFVTPDE